MSQFARRRIVQSQNRFDLGVQDMFDSVNRASGSQSVSDRLGIDGTAGDIIDGIAAATGLDKLLGGDTGLNALNAQPETLARFSPPQGKSYTVKSGDTLDSIARANGTTWQALKAMNPQIANANLIRPGQKIALPANVAQNYTVQRGDTLTEIARENNTSVAALMKANPEIRNANQIYPGQVVRVAGGGAEPSARPSAAPAQDPRTQAAAPVGSTQMKDGTLALTQTDINNIKKTLQTEWIQSAGDAQAKGIIDTILNRTASGHWGKTVSDVVNKHNQFSDINGPIARRDGRNSVEDLPMSSVSKRVDTLVDQYLAQRAAGAPSSIGTHLNYANPHFSDKKNLPWIMALDGPVLGKGNAIHRHGTTPDLEDNRPGNFAVVLPGQAAPKKTAAPAAVNGDQARPSQSEWVNPTGGGIRNDSGGHGHYGASRKRKTGPGVHHGLDILSTPGQAVKAPISGTLTQVNPNNVQSGFQIVSKDGRTAVRVFYAAPDRSLIGKQVEAGATVATAQDLQMRGQYSPNVRDHVHVEVKVGGKGVDPAPYFFR